MTLRERVARAMCAADNDNWREVMMDWYGPMADAAIAAVDEAIGDRTMPPGYLVPEREVG